MSGIGRNCEGVGSRLLNISDLEKIVIGHLLLARGSLMGVLDFSITKLLRLSDRVGLEQLLQILRLLYHASFLRFLRASSHRWLPLLSYLLLL
jgi:hypothetical protein